MSRRSRAAERAVELAARLERLADTLEHAADEGASRAKESLREFAGDPRMVMVFVDKWVAMARDDAIRDARVIAAELRLLP